MSAEQKWCFSNWPKGETNIFQLRIPHWFRGYVSPNQIHLLFGTFAPKMGQKGLKIGLKCFSLVWYGLVWLSCDPNWSEKNQKHPTASCSEFQSSSRTLRNQTFSLAILDNLKKVSGFSHDPESQLCHTKPYHTKPRHFRPIFRSFSPIFRAKVPKSKWVWFEDTYPLNL